MQRPGQSQILLDGDRDKLLRARLQKDLLPTHQAPWWLASAGRQSYVYLCHLRTGHWTGICHAEVHLEVWAAADGEIREGECRVRQAETERELRRDFLGVVPLVADQQPF